MSRLGDRLRLHARDAAEQLAVHAGERWWSFRALAESARALALEVGPGEVVAIAIDRGIEAVLAVCATALAGAIPALIDPRDRELAARTLAGLRPAAVLVAPGDDDLPGARVIEAGRPARPATAAAWTAVRRAEATAHLIFTSGSTASGKGVAWSELRAGFDWMLTEPGRAARERPSGIVAPLCTSLGYSDLAHALYHATSVALLDAPFPAAIAQARDLGVDRLRFTPTHAELLLATAEQLPDLRSVVVTSARIAPERLRALAARLPTAQIARSYGLTECGPAAMVWLHQRPGKLHTVGRPVALRRVTVRDDAGRMLPPGQTGHVVVELPMWDATIDGYLDAPPELARRFDNGVLWTGDRGAFDDHGFLVLGARSAELLKVGGRSVGATRIEEGLAAHAGIAELAVVGVPDRLLGEVPCAVFVPAAGCDVRRLVDGGAPEIELLPDERPRWWLARRDLPRGPSGKLRRGQLAEEAARWTAAFPDAVVPEHRPYPARLLDGGRAVIDGCPAAWIGETAGLDPGARFITLVARDPLRPRALAILQPGADAAVRFIVGPIAVAALADDELAAFAEALAGLADRLPGPATRAIYTLADPPASHEIAATAVRLTAWARRCAELVADRPRPAPPG